MNDFIIKQIHKDYAKYLVFGTSVESPIFLLDEIKKQLCIEEGENVLFDQLLQTGNAGNRFLAITINNDNFDFGSVRHIDTAMVDEEVRAEIVKFLRANETILKYSILMASQKEIVVRGGII